MIFYVIMQEELEELRLFQMEKELELKEAATRRRLLTLKQQLQNEAAAANSSTVLPHPQATAAKTSAGKREDPTQQVICSTTGSSVLVGV